MTTIVFGSRKGGCAKTTSTTMLGGLLAREGKTALIDADPQGSLMAWSVDAGETFPCTVIAWPTRDLAKRVQAIAEDFRNIVIDCGRGAGQDDPVLRSALMVADLLVIPASPTLLDVREIGMVMQLVTDIEPLHRVQTRVLLTRVRAGTRSLREAREGLEEAGLPLLRTTIGLRESYARAYGTTIEVFEEYEYLFDELRAQGVLQ